MLSTSLESNENCTITGNDATDNTIVNLCVETPCTIDFSQKADWSKVRFHSNESHTPGLFIATSEQVTIITPDSYIPFQLDFDPDYLDDSANISFVGNSPTFLSGSIYTSAVISFYLQEKQNMEISFLTIGLFTLFYIPIEPTIYIYAGDENNFATLYTLNIVVWSNVRLNIPYLTIAGLKYDSSLYLYNISNYVIGGGIHPNSQINSTKVSIPSPDPNSKHVLTLHYSFDYVNNTATYLHSSLLIANEFESVTPRIYFSYDDQWNGAEIRNMSDFVNKEWDIGIFDKVNCGFLEVPEALYSENNFFAGVFASFYNDEKVINSSCRPCTKPGLENLTCASLVITQQPAYPTIKPNIKISKKDITLITCSYSLLIIILAIIYSYNLWGKKLFSKYKQL